MECAYKHMKLNSCRLILVVMWAYTLTQFL